MRAFRELKISLAAKCQLLFGIAVALIIGAALFAPWQRMEQLTEELDRRSARTLTDHIIATHVAQYVTAEAEDTAKPTSGTLDRVPSRSEREPDGPAGSVRHVAPTSATSAQGSPVHTQDSSGIFSAGAATQPLRLGKDSYFLPRFVGAARPDLTITERRALARFARRPDEEARAFYYTRRDGVPAYRYTRALYIRSECLPCHADDRDRLITVRLPLTTSPTPTPTTAPTTPKEELIKLPPGLFGTITVDLASQRETNQVLLNRVFFLAAGLLAGSLAIAVFSLITGRFILQPVRVLQKTAEKVSSGDLDIRSHIGTGDEFEQLSNTINTMLSNLQRSEGQLRAANRSLDAKLTQLNETNIALAETNRLKSEFLANVSHELRTPLNSILGFADLLRKSADSAAATTASATADAKIARYANNIHASGTSLLQLITDLLDLAKVEAGRMEVHPRAFSLGELFETLATVLKPLTEPKQISLNTELDSNVPILHQDASKLQQVLYNFLSNAIKYSPTGGTIHLRAALEVPLTPPSSLPDPSASENQEPAQPQWIRISVTDEGPGIEPEKQRLIFEKFRQLDGGVTRTHGGTGLGLAISKELTALLGGRIGVESNVGEGAMFFIVIPTRIEQTVTEVRRSNAASALT